MEEAEVVLGLRLVAGDQAPETHQPCEEALDVPTAAVSAERPEVLSLRSPFRVMRSDHLDP